MKLALICSVLLPLYAHEHSRFLDYAGGNGMFVRMMRDRGYDFYWMDKYAPNEFASGFEAVQNTEYSAVTAFEVFEHLPKPLEAIDEMLGYSKNLIFSTRLLPRRDILPHEWWYFTLDTGQHISLYSQDSLRVVAQKFNLKFSTNGISLHILSKRSISEIVMKAISVPAFANMVSPILNIRRQSLLNEDYFRLTGQRLG